MDDRARASLSSSSASSTSSVRSTTPPPGGCRVRRPSTRGRDVGDSATHSRSGASASKRRSTRSGAGRLGVTTRGARPLATTDPGQAASRITRATRLRLTGVPSAAAPRESSAPRTSHGCVRSLARARSAPRRGLVRRALTGAPRVVPARGDSEHSGHRGDSKLGLIRSHEPVDLPGTVPRANQAAAFAKISRSSRSDDSLGEGTQLLSLRGAWHPRDAPRHARLARPADRLRRRELS